jgi:two-component system, NarL family, nitrate/nitrite response regulator NarL
MRPVRTLVIEQDGLLREGLKKVLAKTRFQPLRAYCTLEDIGELPPGTRDHLVILGACDVAEALQFVARLRERSTTARIAVLLEGRFSESAPQELVLAGANAVLSRSISCELLLKSLDLVLFDKAVAVCSVDLPEKRLEREAAGSEHMQAHPANTQPPVPERDQENVVGSFSDREMAVLSCLEFGGSNKVIGRKLGITEATVKVHLKAIMRKLRVNNRTQAALWAMRQSPASSQPTSAKINGFDHSDGALVASKTDPYATH